MQKYLNRAQDYNEPHVVPKPKNVRLNQSRRESYTATNIDEEASLNKSLHYNNSQFNKHDIYIYIYTYKYKQMWYSSTNKNTT